MRIFFLVIIFAVSLGSNIVFGQQNVIIESEREKAVEAIAQRIEDIYLFPDTAQKMAEMLLRNQKNGVYDVFDDAIDLANVLTRDLQALSEDKHIIVEFEPQWIASQRKGLSVADSLQQLEEDARERREDNYGFEQIKIFPGNIGYLNITRLHLAEFGGATAAAAISFLKNAEAIIIDLRTCRGGTTTMVDLLASYFVGTSPVHLYDFETKHGKSEEGGWTYPYVPGERLPDTPLYILLSANTYSAPESFAYSMQALSRATLVGERSVGAAHVTFPYIATDHFVVRIPNGRPVSPITETNWEGQGVLPDVEVPAERALLVAQLAAFENLANKDKRSFHAWYIPLLEAKLNPLEFNESRLSQHIGVYGSHKISLSAEMLHYQLGDQASVPLIKVAENEFMIEGGRYNFKLSFEEQGDKIILRRTYRNGRSYDVEKNASE